MRPRTGSGDHSRKELLVLEPLAHSTPKTVDVALKNSLYSKSLNSLRNRTPKTVALEAPAALELLHTHLEAPAALELLHTHVLENGTARTARRINEVGPCPSG